MSIVDMNRGPFSWLEDDESDEEAPAERPPDPPGLTWEEHENGSPGQLVLPFPGEVPMLAERVVVRLAREWRELVAAHRSQGRLSGRDADLRALAALMVTIRWRRELSLSLLVREWLENNRYPGRVGLRDVPWEDSLPWGLCLRSLPSTMENYAYDEETLLGNLTHGTSWLRRWIMRVAWVARELVPAEQAIPSLLENVATTLGGPDEAYGLAFALAGSQEAFNMQTKAYPVAENFRSQYELRLKEYGEWGPATLQLPFLRLELDCWEVVNRVAMGWRLKGQGW